MKFLFFLCLSIFLYGDIANTIFKIKYIENLRKKFLKIDYNIFIKKSHKISSIVVNKKKNLNFKIFAIFNNKVNINGKWYKLGDYINGYKIVKITFNGIYLMKKSKIIYVKVANNNILKVK